MDTDIRGAVEAGLQSFLVLTGSTQLEEVGDYVFQPTRVLKSVADLLPEVQSDLPSNRLDSPVFTHARLNRARSGSRHQTDAPLFRKPRPRGTMVK